MDSNRKFETGNSRRLLLGHRGARRYAPENTLAAFDLALEHGCDGFEFDVRRTLDARAVVCHDPRFAGRNVARNSYQSLAEADSSLPSLDDVVTQFRSRAFLYIELKVAGLEDAVIRTLCASPPERGYVVASFLPDVLELAHGRDSSLPLGLICDNARQLDRWPDLPLDYVMPRHSLVSRALVDELHAARILVIVWTVNSERDVHEMVGCGVDGIVSDDTLLLSRTVGRLG